MASRRAPRELERLRVWYASHSDAGLGVVESLQGLRDRVYESLYPASRGLVVLETCNRFEVYVDTDTPELTAEALREALGARASSMRELRGLEAARRLARIAAGLESVILGEPEILGQVREAWLYARRRGYTSRLLDMVFHAALRAGRRARDETRIGEGNIGYPSAAVGLASSRLGGLEGASILIVGTGDAARSMVRIVCSGDYGVPSRVVVAGRRIEKAAALARSYCEGIGVSVSLEEARLLGPYDLALVAVSGRPGLSWLPATSSLVVDISMPPAVPEAPNVIGSGEVAEYARAAAEARLSEVPKVELIVEEEMDRLVEKILEARVDPLVASITRYAESLALEEAGRVARRLNVGDGVEEYLHVAFRSYYKKLLHPLLSALRDAARRGEAGPLLEALAAAYERGSGRGGSVELGAVPQGEA